MLKRDDMFRCPYCKQLYPDKDCTQDPITGAFICPKQCLPTYEQPPYESPALG